MHMTPLSYFEYASKSDLVVELSKESLLEKVIFYNILAIN